MVRALHFKTSSVGPDIIPAATASPPDQAAVKQLVIAYFERIGIENAEGAFDRHTPREEFLEELLQHHAFSVPFENLSLFDLPEAAGIDGEIAYKATVRKDPSLKLQESLKKIVFDRRGGFCWEINFCFVWLLRALGYECRLGNSYVVFGRMTNPGHLVIFVDNLPSSPLLVDPGFGDCLRKPLPLETGCCADEKFTGDMFFVNENTKHGKSTMCGDKNLVERFDSVLTRQRKHGKKTSIACDKMYALNFIFIVSIWQRILALFYVHAIPINIF